MRAVVRAYAEGRVELPRVPDTGKGTRGGVTPEQIRHAPSFVQGKEALGGTPDRPYTVATVAEFLSWDVTKVTHILQSLETIERGALDESGFAGLSKEQAVAVTRETSKARTRTKSEKVARKVGRVPTFARTPPSERTGISKIPQEPMMRLVGPMVIERTDEQIINWMEYERIRLEEHTTSIMDVPGDAVYRRYWCCSAAFLAEETFPAWFTDPERTRKLNYDQPGATPITFAELAKIPRLRDGILRSMTRPERATPHVITEHCVGWGRRVAKDGCKGFLKIATDGRDVPLRVTEVSGRDWRQARYDMKLVCRCVRR